MFIKLKRLYTLAWQSHLSVSLPQDYSLMLKGTFARVLQQCYFYSHLYGKCELPKTHKMGDRTTRGLRSTKVPRRNLTRVDALLLSSLKRLGRRGVVVKRDHIFSDTPSISKKDLNPVYRTFAVMLLLYTQICASFPFKIKTIL